MTHIANCIRWDTGKSNVYISQETTSFMPLALNDSKESIGPLEKSPLEKSPLILSPSRYQLWPVPPSRSPVGIIRPSASSASLDKLSALSMGRSPTSLSDTAVPLENLPFWQRSGSLSRRRKVSVPELGSTMTTVQEMAIDSPTIPGRPALRKYASQAVFGHERSSSAPGSGWRTGPFGDALMACVSGPSQGLSEQANSAGPAEATTFLDLDDSAPIGKPLSPILSPGVKPTLKVDTTSTLEAIEMPPEVPPKSPACERRGSPTPLVLRPRPSKTQLQTPASATSGGATPLSAMESRRSPNGPGALPTPLSAMSNPFSVGSPSSAFDRRSPRVEIRDPFDRRGSPRVEKKEPVSSPRAEKKDPMASHNRNMSDTSVMDRGRPVRRTSKRQRSRTCSEANNQDTPAPAQDTWKLPRGMRAQEASMRMDEADQHILHKQAHDQADKFEVLNKKDVASMSRELRALDERCDYLRRTYKSLRAGRQKLHGRMISYLKRGETVIFSRESLLKQEEALAELDISIDEFISKLEQAENRRLRLRQKLLEHVAAALFLNPSANRPQYSESTPPRSPVKADSPARMERRDVESIKIYADGHVLNLFSDIEQAIGRMCEQSC